MKPIDESTDWARAASAPSTSRSRSLSGRRPGDRVEQVCQRRALEDDHRNRGLLERIQDLAERPEPGPVGLAMLNGRREEPLPGLDRDRRACLREVDIEERSKAVRLGHGRNIAPVH